MCPTSVPTLSWWVGIQVSSSTLHLLAFPKKQKFWTEFLFFLEKKQIQMILATLNIDQGLKPLWLEFEPWSSWGEDGWNLASKLMTFHGKIETCTILGHGLIRADGFPFEEPEWSSYRPIERELTMYIRGVKTSCLCVANMCICIYLYIYNLYIYIFTYLYIYIFRFIYIIW